MRLTLRQLQIFQAVARHGTTAAAAHHVALSQSATSAALNELERSLGALLFDRVGKRLLLNDAGRTLLPAALSLLDNAHAAETLFQTDGAPAADFKVSASTTIGNYILPRLFARYRESYPAARLALHIGNTLEVVTAVQAFAADIGFVEGPCQAPDVTRVPWLEDELLVVAGPGHALAARARRAAVTPRQLMAALWLLREPGSGTRAAVEQALLPHLPHLPSAMIFGSSEAIKLAAAEGLGLACLSRSVVADFLAAGRLEVLGTRLPRLCRRFGLIHHRSKIFSAALRNFFSYCRQFKVPAQTSWPVTAAEETSAAGVPDGR